MTVNRGAGRTADPAALTVTAIAGGVSSGARQTSTGEATDRRHMHALIQIVTIIAVAVIVLLVAVHLTGIKR